jgi:hypothetical protein
MVTTLQICCSTHTVIATPTSALPECAESGAFIEGASKIVSSSLARRPSSGAHDGPISIAYDYGHVVDRIIVDSRVIGSGSTGIAINGFIDDRAREIPLGAFLGVVSVVIR